MLIKEICEKTKLTKKAIEYYEQCGIISPTIYPNGYRDFSDDELEKLKKTSVLRKIGISVDQIRQALSNESNEECYHKLAIQNEIKLKIQGQKQCLLERLAQGASFDEIGEAIEEIEKKQSVMEKLMCAFPGHYGRYVYIHFARFLNEPITTAIQKEAYGEIIEFLDNIADFVLPKEVESFLDEAFNDMSTKRIEQMIQENQNAIKNPDKFMNDNSEILEFYLEYKQSDEYKNSAAYVYYETIKKFNASNGYNDIFIPAMKRLSPSYACYYEDIERANEILMKRYPQIEQMYNN